MTAPIFIGDELSAAGYRLGGAVVHLPAPGREAASFEWARQQAPLVVITAEVAARLPPALLSQALVAARPPVLIVPDVRGRVAPPDLAHALRRQLGMEQT
jgi:vacuolar-type H+-ATPase subunit F/Vma7